MAKQQKKSVLDEILEWGGRGISGLTSTVSRAAVPIANSFTQNYQENIKKQQQQAQRNRQQLSDFTSNLISVGQKAGSTFLDLYNKTQKPKSHLFQQELSLELKMSKPLCPSPWVQFLHKLVKD